MSEPFTLASWNIFQGLHVSSKRNAWVQSPRVEDRIAALDADVLVLPEAWRFNRPEATWAEDMAASFGYELHQWIADRPSRTRETVQWRMVIMTRIPCRRLDDHVLPKAAAFARRAVVRVQLDSGLTIAGMHLYGIHLLAHRSPRGWLAERREVRKIAATTDVVAGDMNMWGPVVHRDTPTLRPAVRGRTFPARWPHSQIDHLLVSDRVEVLSSEILPKQGSDHLALKATLAARV